MVEVTKPNLGNRNEKNVKTDVENASLCRKNMRYAHFAEICGKRKMWQYVKYAAIAHSHKSDVSTR